MKQVIVFYVFLMIGVHASENATSCNQVFMESYDILGQSNLVTERNFICPGVTNNCCSLSSQLEIFKRWIISGEKKKIGDFYNEFPTVFGKIFAAFRAIEDIAKSVIDATTGVPGSNCNRIASVIEKFSASKLKERVIEQAREASMFLFKAREGMYCALCDADAHAYFNNTDYTMTMSHLFCARFAENLIPYYSFRYEYFIKIARLYAEFVTKCNLRGTYRRSSFLRNDIKLYKHKNFSSEVLMCRKGLKRPGAIASCTRFCRRFNPVKYDESLEGELEKLAILAHHLERRIKRLKINERKSVAAEHESDKNDGGRSRILEVEENKKPHKAHLDTETDEIITFNREFTTALLRPIPYHFKADLGIKYNVQFDESIIKTGFEKIYDVVEYRNRFQEVGLDFNSYGQMALIDRDVAMKIFDLINPEANSSDLFDNYMKSK